MFKITKNQWEKMSDDYRSVINGVKYIMSYGCSLVPVEIAEDGNELRIHLFEDGVITYSVLAWNFQDAIRTAKENGHKNISNLRLKK